MTLQIKCSQIAVFSQIINNELVVYRVMVGVFHFEVEWNYNAFVLFYLRLSRVRKYKCEITECAWRR